MNLDINTPKGQEFLSMERNVIEKIKDKWKEHDIQIIETNKKRESRIDNLIIRNGELVGIAEIKCRNISLQEMERLGDTWLISNQKVKDGALISKLLAVPFTGFLYLIPDDLVLYWVITDSKGRYNFKFDVVDSTTQYSCNGGTIVRENAYLPRKYSNAL